VVNKDKLASEVRQKGSAGGTDRLEATWGRAEGLLRLSLEALHVWEMMLDDMSGVENLRRDTEARTRTVLVDKLAVS